ELAIARVPGAITLIEARHLVRRLQLAGHLDERLIAVHEVVEGLESRPPRLQVREVELAAADAVAEVGAPERSEKPDLVPRDRSAKRQVVLLHRLDGGDSAG